MDSSRGECVPAEVSSASTLCAHRPGARFDRARRPGGCSIAGASRAPGGMHVQSDRSLHRRSPFWVLVCQTQGSPRRRESAILSLAEIARPTAFHGSRPRVALLPRARALSGAPLRRRPRHRAGTARSADPGRRRRPRSRAKRLSAREHGATLARRRRSSSDVSGCAASIGSCGDQQASFWAKAGSSAPSQ